MPFNSKTSFKKHLSLTRHHATLAINLHGDSPSRVYSINEPIPGEVTIAADVDLQYQSLQVTLEGRSIVWTRDDIGVEATATHGFIVLRLQHEQTLSTDPYILKAGTRTTIPFSFVLPRSLPPAACNHHVVDPLVHYVHTELPPTLGGDDHTGFSNQPLDDMSPDSVQVWYCVKATFRQMRPKGAKNPITCEKLVRFVPTVSEERPPPPWSPSSRPMSLGSSVSLDRPEIAHQEIKTGSSREARGYLTLERLDSTALRVQLPDCRLIPTTLPLRLRFSATGAGIPPQLDHYTASLDVMTFFSAHPWSDLPTDPDGVHRQSRSGVFTKTLQLSTGTISAVEWGRAPLSCSESTSSSELRTASSYDMVIHVPVSVPEDKYLVPTFQSCYVSRCYQLQVQVYYGGRKNMLSSPISLRVPVTVVCA